MQGTVSDSVEPSVWIDISGVRNGPLRIDRFTARTGEVWCCWGANGSGVDLFVDLLRGSSPPQGGELLLPADLGVVTFRDQQELFEQEVREDQSDYLDRPDPGTPARDFLGDPERNRQLIAQFGLDRVLDRGYRQLSSGEGRKLLILAAVTAGSSHLLIENPYDGLDQASCAEFDRTMAVLVEGGIQLILVLSSRADIPAWCTHLAWIENRALAGQGARAEVLAGIERRQRDGGWEPILEQRRPAAAEHPAELVRLVDGRARYGERTIFAGLDFTVRRHQHTLISGPNGAGKSTLLGLVTGDHPDCYTNELYLFGRRRGSGESIWQIKRDMGIVSPALHREHYIPGNCLQIVVSGFFDSIGLYRRPTAQQLELAAAWLAVLGLAPLARSPFRRVGYGEQRLLLIARALIKMPALLVLDEPTHGLDDDNRGRLLDFLELVVDRRISTVIYVSHRRDEFRGFFRQHLEFDRLTGGASSG